MKGRLLVHADGGLCHGMALHNHDGCPGCGITPDTQSTEFWPEAKVLRCWCGDLAERIALGRVWCFEHTPRCKSGAHFMGNCQCSGL